MKKVLFVSYFFPPIGGGGVLRIAKFAKYLSRLGWQMNVVTVAQGLYPIEDKSLLEELSDVKITRVNYWDPAFYLGKLAGILINIIYPLFLIPDNQIFWLLAGYFRAKKIIKQRNIDLIFTSSRSYTDHLIGWLLKKNLNVKWVADFRDEWTQNPNFKFPTPLHRWIQKILEKKVLENADKIITISSALTESFQQILKKETKKFLTITNGFDPDDIKKNFQFNKRILKISYAGSLYGGRTANIFLEIVKEINHPQIKIQILGRDVIISHKESLAELAASDILLFILSPQDSPNVFSGKIFEYLALGKPILALAPKETAAAKLIKKLKAGIIVEPGDKEAIRRAILEYFSLWQKGKLKVRKYHLEDFNRKNLSEKLSRLFLELSPERKPRLCLIGDLSSIHNQRWVEFFLKNYEIHFITPTKAKIPGIKIYYLGERKFLRHWTPFEFIRSLIQIRKILQKIKPDLVHGQNLIFGGLWAALSGFRPVIITVWGSDIFRFKDFIWLEQDLIRKALARADLITGSSLALKEGVKKIDSRDTLKFQEIQFGVDLKEFYPARKDFRYGRSLGLTPRDRIIFCPRFIKSVYNIDILIKAFAKILPENKDLKLLLIRANADLSYLGKITSLIEMLGIKREVVFIEEATRSQMNKLFNLAEVVVSIPSHDSSAVSVLEAMACGRKIVLSDIPFVREWFSLRVGNFWLARPRDVKETSQALLDALGTKDFFQIVQFNRNLVAQKADFQTNFSKMDKLYRQFL